MARLHSTKTGIVYGTVLYRNWAVIRCAVYASRFQAENDRILTEYGRLHAVLFDRGAVVKLTLTHFTS